MGIISKVPLSPRTWFKRDGLSAETEILADLLMLQGPWGTHKTHKQTFLVLPQASPATKAASVALQWWQR